MSSTGLKVFVVSLQHVEVCWKSDILTWIHFLTIIFGSDNSTDDGDVDSNFADDDGEPTVEANTDQPDAAGNPNEEMRELIMLQAAEHVKMARIQRKLYQQKVAEAVEDAKVGRAHSERRYTFVVDYGQNMELPIFNKEQPGVTYYYSPLSIYNLGIVDHAHDYGGGDIKEHLHCALSRLSRGGRKEGGK